MSDDVFNLNGQAVARDMIRFREEAAEGWASYAAEQERHAETAAARDAHFEARNILAEKVDRLEERLAGAMEVAATIDDARARVVKAARAAVVSDAMKGIRTHNGQPLSPINLRWAATHEALCRSFIFDVLMGLADALEHELPESSWCMREDCRHRNWRSGSMPTHRRGDDCPEDE